MSSEERDKIMEKRTSLRSWRERGGKMPHRGEIIGGGFIILIFLAILATSFFSMPAVNSSSPEGQKKAPDAPQAKTQTNILPNSIPAPAIKINSPDNITYDTSAPPLDFIVAGSNLDSVLLSVDDGPDVVIPHDGTVARIDFAKGDPLFIDDFSGTTKGRWKESGKWRVEGGRYITEGGTSAFGNAEWDDYIIEARTRMTSGKDISVEMRWDGTNNFYRLQTSNAFGNLDIYKINSNGSFRLSSKMLSGIDTAKWHIWKITANGSNIGIFLDDNEYIKYQDAGVPYLKGNLRLRATNTNVEYDYVHVYKPLSEGDHKLTIFANNSAGNSSFQTVYFTVKTAPKAEVPVGKVGVGMIKSGLNITVKNVVITNQYTNVWLSVVNTENKEKQFKIGTGSVIMDNMGQQYEVIKVPRSAEIAQTNLYPEAMREGAVFFEKIIEGRKPKKLVLNINGETFEFKIDQVK